MDKIIYEYKKGTPIKEIAKKFGISEVKVRRILITEGLWHSITSDEITNLVKDGFSAAEIADKLQTVKDRSGVYAIQQGRVWNITIIYCRAKQKIQRTKQKICSKTAC